jgi:hypothetical protein
VDPPPAGPAEAASTSTKAGNVVVGDPLALGDRLHRERRARGSRAAPLAWAPSSSSARRHLDLAHGSKRA